MTDSPASSPDAGVREEARRRLKAKNDFKVMLAIFIVVSLVLVGIWFFSSGPGSYFWPAWPMLGFAIASVFTGFDAYGVTRKYISEADVDAEVRRMQGGGGPKA